MRFTTELLAVALALADVTSAQNSTYNATAAAQAKLTAELANLEKFWSYGRSPPVSPTRMYGLKFHTNYLLITRSPGCRYR
jgi:beta-glucosidase